MVAKKRNNLRSKANAAAVAASGVYRNVSEVDETFDKPLNTDQHAFLHQPRETKKEKQMNKQQTFLSRVKENSSSSEPSFAGISKSAMRRRKRKLRDDLKPKMADLLTSLGKEDDLKQHIANNSTSEGFEDSKIQVTKVLQADHRHVSEPGFIQIKKNEPNIRNQKGAKALSIKESSRMNSILTNTDFQQNPFGALKDVIKMQNR